MTQRIPNTAGPCGTATRTISDPEVQALAMIATTLQVDYGSEDVDWLGSPFAWIRSRPSRQVGAIGERLVAGWLAAKGLDVTRSPDSDADRLINGHRVEIKFSTLWRSGVYKFQQLRDQNYEFAICLGISPFDAHCWAIPKQEIMHRWHSSDGIASQHGGKAGADTAWLSFSPAEPPAWMRVCGGRLSEAVRVIRNLAPRA